jgi:acyl-CoA thioester hydrolase
MNELIPSDLAPTAGQYIGHVHHLPIRIYFEDTDFSGLVYHARYLHFMERARSDMLRCAGIEQRAAFESGEGVYAVAELSIKYVRPARFDDALVIQSQVELVRAASIVIHQRVMRGDEELARATVVAAFLNPDGRPKRQPKDWIEKFQGLLPYKD